jgi:Pectate lyase superfamily protein
MSDLLFNGGAFGIWGGNQQFTSQRLVFDGCHTAVKLNWDWGWTWKSLHVKDDTFGFNVTPENQPGRIGSLMVVDSIFENTDTAVLTIPATLDKGKGTTAREKVPLV